MSFLLTPNSITRRVGLDPFYTADFLVVAGGGGGGGMLLFGGGGGGPALARAASDVGRWWGLPS